MENDKLIILEIHPDSYSTMGRLASVIVRRRFLIFIAVLCCAAHSSTEPCEPRVLEEVPPDPVRIIYLSSS